MNDPRAVVKELQGNTLIHRTGIWLIPLSWMGQESDHAARLNIDAIDIRDKLLDSLPKSTRFVRLDNEKIILLLDTICKDFMGSDCILICNFDLLLAKLHYHDRQYVWKQLYNSFPHKKHALLIAMPETAEYLLPQVSSLQLWNHEKRLAATNNIDL